MVSLSIPETKAKIQITIKFISAYLCANPKTRYDAMIGRLFNKEYSSLA